MAHDTNWMGHLPFKPHELILSPCEHFSNNIFTISEDVVPSLVPDIHHTRSFDVKQRTALIIAAGATAFMLVTAGAVIRTASSQPQRAAALSPSTTAPVATIAAPAIDATAMQYRQLIDEANSRIQQLKDENARLRQEMDQAIAGDNATAPQSAPAAGQISADSAAQVALNLAPGAQLLGTPELVNFQGAMAYEVLLNAGTVYVDANSGQPLHAISARQRNRQRFEQDQNQHDDEHERQENHEGGSDS